MVDVGPTTVGVWVEATNFGLGPGLSGALGAHLEHTHVVGEATVSVGGERSATVGPLPRLEHVLIESRATVDDGVEKRLGQGVVLGNVKHFGGSCWFAGKAWVCLVEEVDV